MALSKYKFLECCSKRSFWYEVAYKIFTLLKLAKKCELVGKGEERRFYMLDSLITSLAYFGMIQNAFTKLNLK